MRILRDVPEHYFWLAVIVIFTLAYGYMGDGDYVEAVKGHEAYCENVASGAWPDYKEADCE
jgi:hypothetical protein